jgi:hypothetical protein
MRRVVRIVPLNRGVLFDCNILPDTECARSLVPADLAPFCGMVDNTNGQGKISTSFYGSINVAGGQQLDCSGLVTFGIQFGGLSKKVSAWVTPSIRREILLDWQTLGELGFIPEAFPTPPLHTGILSSFLVQTIYLHYLTAPGRT